MKKLSESLWADVQSQASGNTVKKEDDFSLLHADGMKDYILDRYVENYELLGVETKDENSLYIAAWVAEGKVKPIYVYFNDGQIADIQLLCKLLDTSEFIKPLSKKYKVRRKVTQESRSKGFKKKHFDMYYYDPVVYVELTPRDHKLCNKDIIDVIDIIMNNTKEPLLTKVYDTRF